MMKNRGFIFFTFILLTLLSCSYESDILKKISNQSTYLDREFDISFSIISKKHNLYQGVWTEYFNKIITSKNAVSDIENYLKNYESLDMAIYSKIDSFLIKGYNNGLGEELALLNKAEFDNWKGQYVIGQDLTDIDRELLLVKIKSIRNVLCNQSLNIIEKGFYNAKKISVVVIPQPGVLKIGDIYSADILLTVDDLASKSVCEINGKNLDGINGRWHLELPCNKKGNFKWEGAVQILNNDGFFRPYHINASYSVR